ncbi:hypothetical protein LOK49_LG12G02940 [Camellia lanceoleosa]|uniref:Uncharacterized protein n=1 Tax=Camellia lanceoleosa TaxID=1840588 RepID=A0ACC0FPV1_9ERIC|nr:hypothetical protein LOK49_LG12G02940 [Camellia lanceoleosa]
MSGDPLQWNGKNLGSQEFKQSIGYQLLRCSSVFDANIHTPVSQLYGEILEENGIDLAEMKVLRRKMEEIAISVNQGSTTT